MARALLTNSCSFGPSFGPALQKRQEATHEQSRLFVTPAQSFSDFVAASRLVHEQYCRVGLMEPSESRLRLTLRDLLPCNWTFLARGNGMVQGTASIQLFGAAGLPASGVFPNELRALAASGSAFAESTKFATVPDPDAPRGIGRMTPVSLAILSTLFNAQLALDLGYWLVVVHPRLTELYTSQLGFVVLGEPRACSHVDNAPGVLLGLPLRQFRNGELELPGDAQGVFLHSRPYSLLSLNRYQPTPSEVTALLLDDPTLPLRCSSGERAEFSAQFPALLERLESSRFEGSDRRYLARNFLPQHHGEDALGGDTALGGPAVPYALRRLCREVYLLLLPLAEQRQVLLQWQVNDQIPDSLAGDPTGVGRMLFTFVGDQIRSTIGSLSLRVDAESAGASSIRLSIRASRSLVAASAAPSIQQQLAGAKLSSTLSAQLCWLSEVVTLSLPTSLTTSCVSSQQRPVSLAKISVLVVEDSRVFQVIARRLLQSWGASVTIAADGEEGIRLFRAAEYSVVLLDIQLPGISGFAVSHLIREYEEQHPGRRRSRVIATTSFVMPEDEQRCYDAGMDAYLAKPFSAQQLAQQFYQYVQPQPLADRQVHTEPGEPLTMQG